MAVYVAARDLAGSAFIGTHQFIIISPDSHSLPLIKNAEGHIIQPRDLGNNKLGLVIGAQNRGRLTAEFFEASDYQATLEHFNPIKYKKWYRADFDTEVKLVTHKLTDAVFIKRLLDLINNYTINETMDNIPYPSAGLGINSNSWAQSLIKASQGQVKHDFIGADISSNQTIPDIYFQSICPAKPRPALNQ